jgi:adenylate cyclase
VADIGEGRARLTLRFLDPALEHEFQAELAASNGPQLRVGLLVGIGLWVAGAVLLPVLLGVDVALAIVVCLLMAALNVAGFFALRWATTLSRQQAIGLGLNVASALAVLLLAVSLGVSEPLAAPALLLIATFAFVVLRLRFVFALVAAGTYLVAFTAIVTVQPSPIAALQWFLVTAAILVGLGATLRLERGDRDVYAQRRVIEAQAAALAEARATSDRLLLNVLPAPIAERLATGETAIADWFDDATVLFADLVAFTQLAAALGPRATRDLLDRIFTGFDALAVRHGLEKIKTIGDAYMVVGGVPEPSDDHPARAVALGLDLLDFAARIGAELDLPLDLRIGIHTGPVVAGVIGTQRFSYDLWGDTVNVASRLESNGIPGSLQLSETTWERVRDVVEATPREPIEVKGRGRMATFLVARRAAPAPEAMTIDGAV